jgi:hypothetical protein
MKTKRVKKPALRVLPRDELVMVRLQSEEHARIAEAAIRRGLGLSALVRMAVLEWLNTQAAKS